MSGAGMRDALGEVEAFEERAAIMEYDGGLTNHEAEAEARRTCGAAPIDISDQQEVEQVSTARSINIKTIRTDGHTQSRVSVNEATVNEYAEALAHADDHLPAVVVFNDGKDYWLADGFHRVAAYEKSARASIPADVRIGSKRDALLHSIGCNAKHGLRRSNEDKRKAVGIVLDDAEWSKLSDREVAKLCAVSNMLIGGMRKERETPAKPPPTQPPSSGGGNVATPKPSAGVGSLAGDAVQQPTAPAGESSFTRTMTDDTNAADAYGDVSTADLLDQTQAELEAAQKTITAMQANDKTAEIIKWQQIAAVNERRMNEHLGTIRKREAALTIMTKRLRAIGELVGEDDPDKVLAAVKLFVENAIAVS
jgi:hypothetical protein